MTEAVVFMGLQLKNPLIVAAGPWSRDHAAIQKAINAGAAAVVTETIALESSSMIYPRVYARNGEMLNTTLYSTIPFEAWEDELRQIDKKDSFLICNIRGSTPSELSYIATRMERWGADGLELSPFTPIGTKLESAGSNPDDIFQMLRSVLEAVTIPVSIRLPSHLACTRAFVKAIERSGAKAVSTTETMKALWGVDIEQRTSLVPTFGGYSGTHLFPITLATIATLSQLTNCEISAMGGVRTFENVLEAIMLGASTVQLGSAILLEGYQAIQDIVSGLEDWMTAHRLSSYDQIRGAALPTLATFEELEPRRMHAARTAAQTLGISPSALAACQKACLQQAILDTMEIDAQKCNGCGLCVSLLPQYFEMRYCRQTYDKTGSVLMCADSVFL